MSGGEEVAHVLVDGIRVHVFQAHDVDGYFHYILASGGGCLERPVNIGKGLAGLFGQGLGETLVGTDTGLPLGTPERIERIGGDGRAVTPTLYSGT